MEEKNKVNQLIGDLKEYAETRFDLAAINIQDKISIVISSFASTLAIITLSLFVVFFISVGTAWWIGQLLHSTSIGFFIVAGFYFLAAVIIYMFREQWIRLPIINSLLSKININEED